MTTRIWDAAYESSPAGSDPKSQGDDRIRENKVDVRERENVGGHVWKDANKDLDGRHAVDAGGSGISPHIYKANKTSLLVEYTDALIRLYENLQLDKNLIVTGTTQLNGALTLGATSSLNVGGILNIGGTFSVAGNAYISGNYTTLDDDFYISADTSGGNITITLTAPGTPIGNYIRLFLITKLKPANVLTIQSSHSFFVHGNNGFPADNTVTPFKIPDGVVGSVLVGWNWSVVQDILLLGNLTAAPRYLTGNATLNTYDELVFCDTTGGAFTVTLAAMGGVLPQNWKPQTIKLVAGAGAVTIAANTGQTIDGATPVTLTGGTKMSRTVYPRTTTDYAIIDGYL